MRDSDSDEDILDVEPVRRRQPDIGEDAGIRLLIPVGRSGWAIASGYLGLLSLLIVPAPFALLTGILAVREMQRNPKKHGMGRAIFGIVMGSLGTIVLILAVVSLVMPLTTARGR
jgi:hypothetical protein